MDCDKQLVEDSRTVIQFLTPAIRRSVEEHLFTRPDLFSLGERALKKHLGSIGMKPTPTDNRLRMRFWMAYEESMAKQSFGNISAQTLALGICEHNFLILHYFTKAEKVAWLMTRPAAYETVMEEALYYGIDMMRDILDEDHHIGGKINVPLMNLKLKIVSLLDTRLKGAPVQKSLHLHSNIPMDAAKVAQATQLVTMEDLQKKSKEYEAKLRRALHLSEPIDVESIGVEQTKASDTRGVEGSEGPPLPDGASAPVSD